MIAFDSHKMSSDEWNFIRLYCAAVERDYDLIQIICSLVHPNFHVKTLYAAIQLGLQMYQEQCKVVNQLLQLGEKHTNKKIVLDKTPTESIADIFTKSFFKIIDSETKSIFISDKKLAQHDGWSSGHPAEWQRALHDIQKLHGQNIKTKNTAHSAIMSALFNLFSVFPQSFPFKNWKPQAYEPGLDWDYCEEDEYDDDADYG